MSISRKIKGEMANASWIRRMFEQGTVLKQRFGESNVFDFTLGNPLPEPPLEVQQAFVRLTANPGPGSHRYMSNAGYAETREAVARTLRRDTGLPFTENHVLMTVGAAGGLNILLKSILDPGDEVIVIAPYFAEYIFYVDNHSGRSVIVEARDDFDLDLTAISAAIGPRTRAVLVNSPNNPTGAVYERATLDALGELLARRSRELGTRIYLVSDEAYRKIVFDGLPCPTPFLSYDNAIRVTSHSKDLALPGERIGSVAVSPKADDAQDLFDAMVFANRTLGFVNAPALMQRVAEACQDASVDISYYQSRRDRLYEGLTKIGYEVAKPRGAFYLFPKSPIEDDLAFTQKALAKNILIVPGTGFGRAGHFRIAYCSVDERAISRAMNGFEALWVECRG